MTALDFLKNNYLGIIITSLLTSTIAAFIVIRILRIYKPKIEISPIIAEGISSKNGQTKFTIKVINRTKYCVFDIKARLHIIKKYQTATGEILKSELIELKQSEPFILAAYSKKKNNTDFTFRFLTYEDLNTKWDNDKIQYLKFRLICRHEISGNFGHFSKEYRLKGHSIKKGDFDKGDSYEIH
jgi:hypothetical protein